MDTLYTAFRAPSAAFRGAPLWVWNDDMTVGLIEEQLQQLKQHGFGGAFVHPRPGLITPYLSEEWFHLWGAALQSAKRLGLKLYIYDENSYPSGFAGGHVPSQLPNALSTAAAYKILDWQPSMATQQNEAFWLSPDKTIKVFACEQRDDSLQIGTDLTLLPRSEWADHTEKVFVVELVPAETLGWLGGFANVDLLRPEVTDAFINSTHEAYRERFGRDFGDTIPALFTDEPSITDSRIYNTEGGRSLPFSYWFANEFERLNGYSLLENLPCIFRDVDGSFDQPASKVRYDYYKTIRILWTKNSIEPISQWCEANGIAYTGHYMEHQWPFAGSTTISPSLQSAYEYHQWPGIDLLMTHVLRDSTTDPLLITIQEVRSAANQFQKERTLCELYGAGGWESTFADYKRMADWVLVNGINLINQHLTYATIQGARKRDHPQSFDWREPWWGEYTQLNDYLGRASTILASGKMEQRILVLNPTTTAYLVPREEEAGSLHNGDAITNPDMRGVQETVQFLTDQQWDFDLGDEFTLERYGEVAGKALQVSAQSYDVVVVPGDMKNMLRNTVRLLEAFAEAGGTIIATGSAGGVVDGLAKDHAFEGLRRAWQRADSNEALQDTLLAHLKPRLRASQPWARGVAHMRRVLDDGRVAYFFVNHSLEPFEAEITTPGTKMAQWDLYSGDKQAVPFSVDGDEISFPLRLVRNQSALFVVGDMVADMPEDTVETVDEAVDVDLAKHQLTFEAATLEEPNMLPLEYLDLHFGRQALEGVHHLKAADQLFRARGYDGNPWDNKVQFKSVVMDTNTFGPGSGFEATFTFYVADDFYPEALYAVVERAALCRVAINGHEVPYLRDQHVLDHHNGVVDITSLLRAGENELSIIADKFDVRLELEPVYLRGDFSVTAVNGRWVLDEPKPLSLGSWREQGYPFYSQAVLYEFSTVLSSKPKSAALTLPQWEATCVSVRVNGKDAGLYGADGDRPLPIADYLHKGRNEIVVRVCGSLKNLLGPHHMRERIRGSAWPGMWRSAPTFRQPDPSSYDLIDYGLYEVPEFGW